MNFPLSIQVKDGGRSCVQEVNFRACFLSRKMEDERINILMKYVRGEISFAEWIESGGGAGDAEIEDNGMQVDTEGDGESQAQMAEAGDIQMNTAASEGNSAPTGKLILKKVNCLIIMIACRLLDLLIQEIYGWWVISFAGDRMRGGGEGLLKAL